MTRFEETEGRERRTLLAEAIVAHRKRASERAVFEASDDGTVRVEYADRLIRLDADDEHRERLDDLLSVFPVFKLKQPETRKAPEGTVFVSAIADPKHAADFVERVFTDVYGEPDDYRLWVVQV